MLKTTFWAPFWAYPSVRKLWDLKTCKHSGSSQSRFTGFLHPHQNLPILPHCQNGKYRLMVDYRWPRFLLLSDACSDQRWSVHFMSLTLCSSVVACSSVIHTWCDVTVPSPSLKRTSVSVHFLLGALSSLTPWDHCVRKVICKPSGWHS